MAEPELCDQTLSGVLRTCLQGLMAVLDLNRGQADYHDPA